MSRVLLVNMPFANLRWPNIGPSLLKGGLARRGIGCDIAYFNFDFAERIGLDHYYWLADYFAFVLGGERLFAKHHFGERLPDDDAYYREVLLRADRQLDAQARHDYEQTGRHVLPFLDDCVAAVDWSRYAVVGFATSFQQMLPSVMLADRVKQRRPETTIVFGGAACEGDMGVALLRQFPVMDYVFLGEADRTFPDFAEQIIRSGEPSELPPGIVGRKPLAGNLPPKCSQLGEAADARQFMTWDLDQLPYPDFDDYFARWRRSTLRDEIEPLLFFEMSRGCWWGQKHHCKFCGLNGSTLAYRSKSPDRVMAELKYLVDRYDVHKGCSADNILDHRYFDELLPRMRPPELDLAWVCEMKTNLTRSQVEALLAAGMGAAQLGIETFLDPVLKLIGKGATAMHNLQALKWFSEAGIEVKWNLLYGFPGENPDDYAAMARLIPSLVHMAPPLATGRVRLDRFSPYFEDPPRHGMLNPRPNAAFSYVYPFPKEVLEQMAYYYEYDYADQREPLDYAAPVLEAIEQWQQLKDTVTLRCFDRDDGVLLIHDTRPGAAEFQHRLSGAEREAYKFCDTSRSFKTLWQHLAAEGHAGLREERLKRTLGEWVDHRLMARIGDRYLSLALRPPAGRIQ